MALLITDIKCLVGTRESYPMLKGKKLAQLPCIDNAYIIVEGEQIAAYGPMSELKHDPSKFSFCFSAGGQFVLPSWCDSHTHLVFTGSREDEFVDKIQGLTYAEIAAKGGGILNTAHKLAAASEDKLFNESYTRLQQIAKMGTGAVEIKSGYGLSVAEELKMLRVIRRLKNASKIPIRVSFLGAHAYPAAYKENHEGYISLIKEEMLPVIAAEGLADYIDVFCETGFFSPEETVALCAAGMQYGLKPKIHAHQLGISGGVAVGIKMGAISVDHLEVMDKESIQLLSRSHTIGTLLPSAAFFLRMPYQQARQMIDGNCAIALASDYNPGSSPSGNMNFVLSLSCIQMRMLPQEAIQAATINGAYAMELHNEVGTITTGKKANLIVTKPLPSLAYLPYAFGDNLIDKVMLCGEWL